MVRIDGGTFMIGATAEQGSDAADDEKPVRQVTLSDYYMGKYEVTPFANFKINRYFGCGCSTVAEVSGLRCKQSLPIIMFFYGLLSQVAAEAGDLRHVGMQVGLNLCSNNRAISSQMLNFAKVTNQTARKES